MVDTVEAIASPAILRLIGLPLTPLNGRHLAVSDLDGVVDCTDGMQEFLTAGLTNGDEMKLPAVGVKAKISTTLNIEGDGKNFAGLTGCGRRSTLAFAAGNFHKLRIALTDELHRKMGIKHIWIESGTIGVDRQVSGALPTDGKVGFLLDATSLITLEDIGGMGCDILFAAIHNCYNHNVNGIYSDRFDSNNYGIYLPVGVEAGSDCYYERVHLFVKKSPIVVNGAGGHYSFKHGQCSSQSGFVATDDTLGGLLTLGKGLMGDSNTGGTYGITLEDINLEGSKGRYAIRTYDEFTLNLLRCGFVASVQTAGQLATGLLYMTDNKMFQLRVEGCEIGASFFSAAANALVASSGTYGDLGIIDEGPWRSAMSTCNGVSTGGDGWFQGFNQHGYGGTRGFGRYVEGATFAVHQFGGGRIRSDFDGPIQKSNNYGAYGNIET